VALTKVGLLLPNAVIEIMVEHPLSTTLPDVIESEGQAFAYHDISERGLPLYRKVTVAIDNGAGVAEMWPPPQEKRAA